MLQITINKESILRNFSGKAPTFVVWVISLVLFIVALLAQFGVVRVGAPIATWSWIIGFGLLLLACRVKGLLGLQDSGAGRQGARWLPGP